METVDSQPAPLPQDGPGRKISIPIRRGAVRPGRYVPPTPPDAEPGNVSLPPGWWNLRDLSGSLDGVIRALEQNKEIPSHWRTAIIEDLKLRCADGFNFVYLDAHFHVEKGNAVLHYHAVPDKKLL